MSASYDVIIVGLGAMGSAAAYHLARRGRRVLGIDRFEPPHTSGSSHGQTRIIREAYFEHPSYVPLVQRAYQLWAGLERDARQALFLQTGGLLFGRPEGVVAGGALRSATKHHLRHEVLDAEQLRRRFPMFTPAAGMIAVWEPRAGILFPETCVAAHLAGAREFGAELRYGQQVTAWSSEPKGVLVQSAGETFRAARLILSAGAWLKSLVPDLNLPLRVERQIQFWFTPREAPNFDPQRCPIHIWEYEPQGFFYGFPDLGQGVKVAIHHAGVETSPDALNREVSPDEVERMRALVRRHLPGANGELRSTAVCMYTDTPDEHFLIDRHRMHPQVILASPCSGHGFKFSSAIGEALADLAEDREPKCDLSLFRYRW